MRAQSQYLRIHDTAGATFQRWQNFHAYRTVTWSSAQWLYQPFLASGLTAGQAGDESGVTVSIAATGLVVDAILQAIAQGQLVTLQIYQFDGSGSITDPPAGQELVAQFTGQVVGAGGTLTELQIELGSSLSPVGAQIPPRTYSTQLIGMGCRL